MVATVESDSVAHRALEAEGVPHAEHLTPGDFGYPELLAELWSEGGFVLVEGDIVPWPGAVESLLECEADWCYFRYPKNGHLIHGTGCCKFSDRLVDATPELPEQWESEPFWEMDQFFLGAVSKVGKVCKHTPPVGHVRGRD